MYLTLILVLLYLKYLFICNNSVFIMERIFKQPLFVLLASDVKQEYRTDSGYWTFWMIQDESEDTGVFPYFSHLRTFLSVTTEPFLRISGESSLA